MSCGSDNYKILQVGGTAGGGGPYTVVADTPNTGDYTVTDTGSGNTFVIPAPIAAQVLADADGDTGISTAEGAGANGGDLMTFTVDGVTVGSVEVLAGGVTKWTLDGILDPIIYRPTPQTTAQLTALTSIAVLGDIAFDSDLGYHVKFDGTNWVELNSPQAVANDRVFITETALTTFAALATASSPTSAEIKAYNDSLATPNTDTVLVYNGTDVDGLSTHVFHSDASATITQLASSGIASGIDDVLSANQTLTAQRKIDLNGNILNIGEDFSTSNSAFRVDPDGSTSPVTMSVNGNTEIFKGGNANRSALFIAQDASYANGYTDINYEDDVTNPVSNFTLRNAAGSSMGGLKVVGNNPATSQSIILQGQNDAIVTDATGTDFKFISGNETLKLQGDEGTAGQVLTSNGSISPTWEDPSSGVIGGIDDVLSIGDSLTTKRAIPLDGNVLNIGQDFTTFNSAFRVDPDGSTSPVTMSINGNLEIFKGSNAGNAALNLAEDGSYANGYTDIRYQDTIKSHVRHSNSAGGLISGIDLRGSSAGDGTVELLTGGVGAAVIVNNNGSLRFPQYVSGQTGTPTSLLAVDTAGNVLRTDFGKNYLTKQLSEFTFIGTITVDDVTSGVDTLSRISDTDIAVSSYIDLVNFRGANNTSTESYMVIDIAKTVSSGNDAEFRISDASILSNYIGVRFDPFTGAFNSVNGGAWAASNSVVVEDAEAYWRVSINTTGMPSVFKGFKIYPAIAASNGTATGVEDVSLTGDLDLFDINLNAIEVANLVTTESLSVARMSLDGFGSGSVTLFPSVSGVGQPMIGGTANAFNASEVLKGSNITADHTTGIFTISKGGDFKARLQLSGKSLTDDAEIQLVVNGVVVDNLFYEHSALVEYINVELLAYNVPDSATVYIGGVSENGVSGDDYSTDGDISSSVATRRISCVLEELPTSTVVMPDALAVEDVEVLEGDVTAQSTGNITLLSGGRTWNDLITDYEYIDFHGMNFSASVSFRWSTRVKTSEIAQGDIIRWSDSTTFINGVIGALNTGDWNPSLGNTTSYDLKVVGVKAQKTVINTTDVAVNDQSTSGYMDIGTMRIQWGTVAASAGGGNPETVTFPVPFANTTYSFVATTISGATDQARNISIRDNTTTTSIDVEVYNTTNHGSSTAGFNWQAIGIAP